MKKLKIFICMLGLDQHDVGAIAVSRLLSDAGMEVVYGGKFQMPETIIKTCIEEDVNLIGISCHSWEYIYYLPELIKRLNEENLNIPVVVGGSIITLNDIDHLKEGGVAEVFESSASNKRIVQKIKELANVEK